MTEFSMGAGKIIASMEKRKTEILNEIDQQRTTLNIARKNGEVGLMGYNVSKLGLFLRQKHITRRTDSRVRSIVNEVDKI